MKTYTALATDLAALHLSPRDAARYLGVDLKTVQRWLDDSIRIPGPALEAVRAWQRLDAAKLPWRPNSVEIPFSTDAENEDQRRLHVEHNVVLDQILQQVKARGGPAAPWQVDLRRHEATLSGVMHVYFYALDDGGFSPSSYSRLDKEPDYDRDQPLIQDAIACIADAIAKVGPTWINK